MLISTPDRWTNGLTPRYVFAIAIATLASIVITWWIAVSKPWYGFTITQPSTSTQTSSADGIDTFFATDTSADAVESIEFSLPRTNQKPGNKTIFESTLKSGDYETAVAEYDYLYMVGDIDSSEHHRQAIINHASAMIQNRETPEAIDLLEIYLALFYNDVDALFTLGRAYRNEAQWFKAIQAFQLAERYAYRATNIRVIRGQLNYAIGFYVQELKQQNKSNEVIELFRYLTQSQPETARYFIGLANAYSDQRRYGEAIDSLRYVQNNFEVGAEARTMMQKLTQLQASWLNVNKP